MLLGSQPSLVRPAPQTFIIPPTPVDHMAAPALRPAEHTVALTYFAENGEPVTVVSSDGVENGSRIYGHTFARGVVVPGIPVAASLVSPIPRHKGDCQHHDGGGLEAHVQGVLVLGHC